MSKKQPKPAQESPRSDLDEAIQVRNRAFRDLEEAQHEDSPKYVDAYQRAANLVRQLGKDRKKSLSLFSDDEVAEYIRSLPERRRDAILIAIQATSMDGKPIFS